MSFWDNIPTDTVPLTGPINNTTTKTHMKNIYTTKEGKFRVYVRHNGKQNCIGTYETIEEAYDAKLTFIVEGIKKPSTSIKKTRRKETTNETIAKYLEDNEEHCELWLPNPKN